MKIKTWEKIYWAVVITLLTLMVIGYHQNTDPKRYVVDGKPLTTVQVYLGIFGFWGGLAVITWLVARYFVNKETKKD